VAKAKPKYSAAAFRRLLAKLADLYRSRSEPQSTGAAAKAEASAARVEAQIKEICGLVSPGFGERFILLFGKQWRSREDANEYLLQRNRILVWLDEFAAAKRKPYIEKARQEKVDRNAIRNKQMLEEYLRTKPSWDDGDTKLMATIGERRRVKRTAAIEIINRGLEERGLRPAKPRKA
jgi:hypothetical protein